MPRDALQSLITYAVASCGGNNFNIDVKKAIEVCVSANKLSNAYMLILYLLNGGEIPRYHPVPLPYVANIEDICIINPEGLALADLNTLAIPQPDYRESIVVKREKDSEKVYKVTLAEVWGLVIKYRTEDGVINKALTFVLTRAGADISYMAIDPPPHITEKLVKICDGELTPPAILTNEWRELLTKSGFGNIEHMTPSKEEEKDLRHQRKRE